VIVVRRAVVTTAGRRRAKAMTLVEFVTYLIIAGVCGAVSRAIAGGTSGGFVVSVLVGFLGAFVGTWLARMFRFPPLVVVSIGGHPFPIVWSIIGGMVLVAFTHAVTRRPYTYVR
jgi:uncharacterized membrane protein YeaQ/YmgE (transglycosylase-associated protein family)